jgi:protein-S-isoprenylcysteine O-methyltransferase Ste14
VVVVVIIAASLFVPAGGFDYWQGWVFMAIIFIPMLIASVYFYKYDSQLAESRMRTNENIREQKLIMRLARFVFAAVFFLPGFDHRFGWSRIPLWVTILSQAIALVGYLLTYWVMKVNSFASRIIEIQSGQKVISTGPYRFVRHPMYLGAIILSLFMPLAPIGLCHPLRSSSRSSSFVSATKKRSFARSFRAIPNIAATLSSVLFLIYGKSNGRHGSETTPLFVACCVLVSVFRFLSSRFRLLRWYLFPS